MLSLLALRLSPVDGAGARDQRRMLLGEAFAARHIEEFKRIAPGELDVGAR